ncbi:MAG: ABC transporter substrate-binding protein [Chloroflexota bacterium]|nr:ABC transporter substrate-binding protein [Chloroflexota bacterium]
MSKLWSRVPRLHAARSLFGLAAGLLIAAALVLSACSDDAEEQQQSVAQAQPAQQTEQPQAAEQAEQQEEPQPAAQQEQTEQQAQPQPAAQQQQAQQQAQPEPAAQQQQAQQQAQPAADEDKTTIVFSDLNWTSSEIQVRAAAFIVEHGFGYPTELIAGDTVSLFQGLINGDTNVTMEIWPGQQPWIDDLEDPTIIEFLGDSLDTNWEGWVVPQYVKDANPGLVSVSDLPEYMELFVTADSRGKARFIDCVPGWACEQANGNKVIAYGLEDVLELVKPGSGAALFEDLESTYNRGEAWLGYIWGPTKPTATLDLYRLEEPEWTEECWNSHQGCAYPDSEVRIAVHHTLLEAAPDVVEFLRAWDFSAVVQVESEIWLADNNATPDDAAIWYLSNNPDVWGAYVPDDVAERVLAALAEES